jgi:methionine-rich copper-binding protein CopC
MASAMKKALALALVISALTAPNAYGHTSVVRTSPTYKSIVKKMPAEISIEFAEELMQLEGKNVNSVAITAPDRSEVPISKTFAVRNVLTALLPEADYLDGTYLIAYRIVSADGHSISGSYEIYLNQPSSNISSEPTEHASSFFHIHSIHLVEAGIALLLILLWWAYRRILREDSE